jgi:hypothetical protein
VLEYCQESIISNADRSKDHEHSKSIAAGLGFDVNLAAVGRLRWNLHRASGCAHGDCFDNRARSTVRHSYCADANSWHWRTHHH